MSSRKGIPRTESFTSFSQRAAACRLSFAPSSIIWRGPSGSEDRELKRPLWVEADCPRLPIETVLIWPGGRPPGNLAARFISLLKAERDAGPQKS
jgi:hypothetical protein